MSNAHGAHGSADGEGRLPQLELGQPTIEEREADARQRIAYLVVGAYFVVLALSVVPIIVYLLSTKDLRPSDVGSLMGTITATVSSVAGVLGFVLGYYFKAVESSGSEDRPRKHKKKAAVRVRADAGDIST